MLSEADNLKLLDKRISELNLKGKIILSFDFDELVVPIHLTRVVTQKVSKSIDKKLLEELGSCSFEGIRYLNSLVYGYDLERYRQIRNDVAEETTWTKGFDNLLIKLSKKYSVIFVSSGLKDICEAKLREINFDPRNILADEFKIENNKIAGSNLVISDELKGYIIKELKKNYRVIAIGHSLGDKTMLDNSDVSISVNSEVPNLAKYNVRSADELLKVIEREAK
jgi:phosphoserine phosphatase